jgi:outer membrane receptor protein involved in Fe transport
MKLNSQLYFQLSILFVLLFFTNSQILYAQENDTKKLDTIVITSQKRPQTLREVPISVTVISKKTLFDYEITELNNLSEFIPNFYIEDGRESAAIVMRGIGNNGGTNFGFENPVGIFKDGVYYGRLNHAWLPYLDIERVEVLRGPQSTLFGMNTVAGAISITTRRPSNELEGYAILSRDLRYENSRFQGAVSIPIKKNLSARLATSISTEEGFFYNTFLDERVNGVDDLAGRLSLNWDISDRFNIYSKIEHLSRFHNGSATQLLTQTSDADALERQLSGDPEATFAPDLNTTQDREFRDLKSNTYMINASFASENFTLNSISAYTDFSGKRRLDIDGSSLQMGGIRSNESFYQISQELRITSSKKRRINFIGGVYYQFNDLSHDRLLDFALGEFITSFAGTPEGEIQTYAGNFDQKFYSFATFAKLDWNITDKLMLSGGLRYTNEKKEANSFFDWLVPLTSNPTNALTPGTEAFNTADFVFHDVFGIERHQDQGIYKNHNWLPEIRLQWTPNENTMFYASRTEGQKSGGFNDRDNRAVNFSFDPESSKNYEIGTKLRLFNGVLETNLTWFYLQFKDMQVSVFDLDNLVFIVENAARATSSGIEFDSRWRLSNNFQLNTYLGWLARARFDEFLVPCTPGDAGCETTPDGNFRDEGGEDLSTPRIFYGLSLEYFKRISNRLKVTGNFSLNHRGQKEDVVNQTTPIEAVTFYNARIALHRNNWSLALIGKNLSDNRFVTTRVNQLFADLEQGEISNPRTLFLQMRYEF